MKSKKYIPDHLFQESFEDASIKPSDSVWMGLENELLEIQATKAKRKRRRWFFLFFVVGILTLAYGGMTFLGEDAQEELGQDVNNDNTSPQQLNSPIDKVKSIETIASNHTENSQKQKTNTGLSISADTNNSIKNINKSEQTISTVVQQPELKLQKKVFTADEPAQSSSFVTAKQPNENVERQQLNTTESQKTLDDQLTNDQRSKVSPILKAEGRRSISQIDLLTNDFLLKPLTSKETNLRHSALEDEISESKDRILRRLSIAFWASRSHFDRKLKVNTSASGNPNQSIAFFNQHESGSSAWSYGLQAGYDVNEKWRIETGLALTRFSLISNYDIPTIYNEGNPSIATLLTSFNTNNIQFNLRNTTGLEGGDLVTINENIEQLTEWLMVPLLATYKIKKGRVHFHLTAGLTTSFFLNNHLMVNESTGGVQDFQHSFSEDAAKTHFSYRGALNIFYHVSPRNAFFIGGHYQNAFTAANSQKAVHLFPSLSGLQFGTQRKF